MKHKISAWLLLVAGLLMIAFIVLFNSLSGGPRSIVYLAETYWPYLILANLLLVGFVWLSRHRSK